MEPIGTGAVANLTSEAAKGVFQVIKRHVKYVTNYEENVEKLEYTVEMLKAKRMNVQQKIEVANNNGEAIKPDVKLWCERVDTKIGELEKKMKDVEEKAKSRRFTGLYPSIHSRHQFSRKARKLITAFDDLLQQSQFDSVGSYLVPEVIVDVSPQSYMAFDSRKKIFGQIMESLRDPKVRIIGVYGTGGVGKTKLVEQVFRQANHEKLFGTTVPPIAVNRTPDIQKIQDAIAEFLGLKLEEKNTLARANRLHPRLKKEKTILLVLDNIWAKLDIAEIGIPSGDQHNGCKILLTSRDKSVLSDQMSANPTFEIGDLEEKEAWELFKKIVGNIVESNELRSLATKVAKRCARLPISITTVAGALRNNSSLAVWKDALTTLENPSPKNFIADVSAEAYTAIKLSYDHLGRDDYKQAFLLCCLLGRKAYISDLLRCAVGLGFFSGVKTVEETRSSLLTAISKFKECCLLLDDYDNKCFDMHDMVRDVALAIASSNSHAFVLKHEGFLDDWPDEKTLPIQSHMISMSFGSIQKLPLELEYPQLSLFSMDSTDAYVEMFPSTFFGKTAGIKVLNLSKIDFVSMPSSINLPTSLRTLCLNQCVVSDIGNIGELKNLEILTFRSCNIEMLPNAIGQLTKLTLLDLSYCRYLKIIAPGVLSNLSRLEELYLSDTGVRWEEEGQANQRKNASLAELRALTRLTTLEVQADPDIMPKDDLLFPQNLERFKIFIGKNAVDWFNTTEYSRELNLNLHTSIDHMEDWAKTLLRQTEALYLKNLGRASIVLKELGSSTEGFFLRLKNLSIEAASEIQYIIDASTGVLDKIEFRQLRSLTLSWLPKLVSFCSIMKEGSAHHMPQPKPHNELPLFGEQLVFSCLDKLTLSSVNVRRIWDSTSYCITSLKSLTITECSKLPHLFSASMAKNMVNLEHLAITGCKSLRKIILVEEDIQQENKADIIFPRLISLVLNNLEHFNGFYSENCSVCVKFPSLTELEIENCPDLKGFITSDINNSQAALFNEKVEFPSLRDLKIAKLRNIKIIWHNQRQQFPADSFSKLTKMVIEHCNELVSIFPSCILEGLKQLVYVSVDDCASLERVFELQRSNTQEETHLVATQLGRLILKNLPKLKHVWNDESQEAFTFEDLREVEISRCRNLVNVFPASVARALRQLQVLHVAFCRVDEIVSKEKGVEKNVSFKFNQLHTLILFDLPNLICFYPGMHTTKWPMLKILNIYKCNRVKKFYTEGSDIQEMEPPPLFLVEKVIPKLELLTLNRDDIEMMCESQVSSNLFQEIKELRVQSYHENSSIFPYSFLGKFKKLQTLSVRFCKFTELFSSESGDSGDVALSRIRNLNFRAVTGLKHIWMQDSRIAHLLPNLESLVIHDCTNLISLGLAPSAPLQSLTTLEVVNCKRTIHLVSSSAIQSLVQLKQLSIKECISMKEIIGNDEDEATYKITFSKLTSLKLKHLPSLTSFCSGKHTFDFPSLEQLVVRQCPELKTFCHGVVTIPKLQYIQNIRYTWL